MMESALDGALAGAQARKRPLVLAVTVLTSLDAGDLRETGISGTPQEAVLRLARLAQSAGLDGVVASAREAAAIRDACGSSFVIVTPGIRPAASLANDQARVATPEGAVRAGVDYLVVGRPITAATEPERAAAAIVSEIDAALQGGS
jgi:orotidine-5'-phosphate decarboxylase